MAAAGFTRIPGSAQRYIVDATGQEISRRQYETQRGRPLPKQTKAQAESAGKEGNYRGPLGAVYIDGKRQRPMGTGDSWYVDNPPRNGSMLPEAVSLEFAKGGSSITLIAPGEQAQDWTWRYHYDSRGQCDGEGWVAEMSKFLESLGEEPLYILTVNSEEKKSATKEMGGSECIETHLDIARAIRELKSGGAYLAYEVYQPK